MKTEKHKYSLFVPVTVFFAAIIAAAGFFLYWSTIKNKIYEVKASEIREHYEIISSNFTEKSGGNYNHLAVIESVMEHSDGSTDSFFEMNRNNWGYTDVYFMDTTGYYISSSGERGRFVLNSQARSAIREGERILAIASSPENKEIALYLRTVKESVYNGFHYQAIALGYDKKALDNTLDVDMFGGSADTFVADREGRVIFADKNTKTSNIFSVISEDCKFEHSDYESFKNAVSSGETWTSLVKINGKSYYAISLDMNFHDWTLIGIIPEDTVNSSIRDIQTVTVFSVGVLLLIVMAALTLGIIGQTKSDIRQTKDRLRYREQLFDVLSNQTDEVFLMFSPNSNTVEYLSPNAERVMGVSLEEAENDIRKIIPKSFETDSGSFFDRLNTLPMGTPEYSEWSRENPATGQLQWFSETFIRVSIENIDRYAVIFSDISEEVENRTHMKEALEIAESANKAKSSFLSNMSHDIRTPLNAITGFCTLLERDADDPAKVREHTKKIKTSGGHLLNLINDVLDMSKIESGKTSLNMSEFSLEQWTKDLKLLILPQAQAKRQDFSVWFSGVLHDSVIGDELRLNQILLNILSNAVKYTPERGKVTMFVSEMEQTSIHTATYRFTVTDDGIGMTPEYLRVIFQPFTRAVNTKVNKVQGTGLGMAIAYNLVKLMGGDIKVESALGRGSKFTVDIGLRISENQQNGDSEAGQMIDNREVVLKGKHFLIAEDNELNSEILTELLKMEGATGEVCENGKKVYERFLKSETGEFDAILMDIQMPEMNGYEASEKIRACDRPDAQTVPIIAMTANAFDEDVKNALESGMNAHVAKPIEMDNLKKAVSEVIGKTKKC